MAVGATHDIVSCTVLYIMHLELHPCSLEYGGDRLRNFGFRFRLLRIRLLSLSLSQRWGGHDEYWSSEVLLLAS